MLKYAIRKSTRWEIVTLMLSVASFIAGFLPAFTATPQFPTQLLLWATAAVAAGWFVLLATRSSFTIIGYRNVMTFLKETTRTTQHRIWTVRTHTGDGGSEEDYFRLIEGRLSDPDSPLEDYRRLFRSTPAARGHALALIAGCINHGAAEARFFNGGGPQFDFVMFDDLAIIGMPMAGGQGNVGAVVLRGKVVEAVAGVFDKLWNDSETKVLFKGRRENGERERQEALAILSSAVSPALIPPPQHPAG